MGRWEGKYVIGITGNIATGKSIVRKMLEHLGAFGIDADRLAHQAMSPGAPAYKPVVETFGRWILDDKGKINRAALAKVVFADPAALAKLEAITHPIILRAINTLIRRSKHKVVAVEAIKLLEGPLHEMVDTVWVVDAPVETQIERLKKRGLSELEARQRIEMQSPQSDKLAQADVIIKNTGSIEDTWKQVQKAWRELAVVKSAPPAPERVTTVKVEKRREAPPEKAAETVQTSHAAPGEEITEVHVKRGKPANADDIAEFLSQMRGQEVTRVDVMMAFGEKAYLVAEANGQFVGIAGMMVEDLITRVDEFHVKPDAPIRPVVTALIQAIEDNSRQLQSEVGFVFLPLDTPDEIVQVFLDHNYEPRTLESIQVPGWREAARESMPPNTRILAKKLRAERVLKPL